jgi:hypothetical protein
MKSQLTQGKGRRPIIGYNNEKFRAHYDAIFSKKEQRQMKSLVKITEQEKSKSK